MPRRPTTPANPARDHIESRRLIGFDELCTILGLHPKTLRRWIVQGKVPRPIHAGSRRLRWRLSTIDRFLNDLEATGHLPGQEAGRVS